MASGSFFLPEAFTGDETHINVLNMKRRTALKSLSVAVGGLVSLPAWATQWNTASVGTSPNMTAANEALLAEIVETIIPETTTPGAKSLNVHRFVLRMINDCYGEPVQTTFQQGLLKTDELARQAYGKDFPACDKKQRTDLLLGMAASAEPGQKQFADLVKGLTIRGYTNSEYYMVNVLKYNMAPGYFHGCVPVSSLTPVSAK